MLAASIRTFQTPEDLEKLVIHAATQYEVNGFAEDFDGVEITDPEYDALVRLLKQSFPASKALKGTSPSQAVAKGKTVKHDPPMTSIDKADGTLDEKKEILNRWINRCAASLGINPSELKLAQSYKRDGVAIRINYEEGKLVSAGLRPRDGINGTTVTEHAKFIEGVPETLPLPLTLSLNGEIECHIDDFDKINQVRDDAGEEAYKNPRNYTAGCMGRDDASEVKDARLRITFYSITGLDEWENYYTNEIERAKWANSPQGLNLKCFVQIRPFKFESLALMEEDAPKLPYYTDGVVLKVSDLSQQEALGHSGGDPVNPPCGALAWKFQEETAEAVVSSIEWNASRTGRIVPTAIFDIPFTLADTDNTRATCNNIGWMEAKGLGPGATVLVKKGGKIIPNIMAVLKPVGSMGAPTNCPTCSTALKVHTSDSGNKDLICPSKECAAKHVKGWIFYITKMGGKGLGNSAMKKILHTGKVKTLADLYKLTVDDLLTVDFSERQATLALATIFNTEPVKDNDALKKKIEKVRSEKIQIEAWKFFAALGISGAGETAGKALVQHFRDFDKIRSASVDDLLSIAGIGDTTAQAIFDWFLENNPLIDELLQFVELQLPKTGKLSGKNFCLTGAFDQGKKHWEALIEAQGGNIQSSVGSQTHYLVQQLGKNDGSPSEKEKKAAKLNVPVISIPDLENILK
jgi:DNA ligase (NAD+)